MNPIEDPIAAYHAIQSKIEQNPDENYPYPEMARDLAHILLACRTLIQQNNELSGYVTEAARILEEQFVQKLEKDIEIYELTQKLTEKDQHL